MPTQHAQGSGRRQTNQMRTFRVPYPSQNGFGYWSIEWRLENLLDTERMRQTLQELCYETFGFFRDLKPSQIDGDAEVVHLEMEFLLYCCEHLEDEDVLCDGTVFESRRR